jgi:adenosine deaminase
MQYEEPELVSVRPDWEPLTELHIHAGGSLPASTMWSIAHKQGIRLPFADYWEFKQFITITREKMMNLDAFLHSEKNPFHWCEVIQSSPEAMEETIYEIAGKAYRSSNVNRIEIRFTPLKRNRKGERDLDHIINGALRGMDRAMLEYPIEVGLIFCLEKKFSHHLNMVTVEKAIKYKSRGVVGIDLAGLDTHNEFNPDEMADVFMRAKAAGLGITVHAGEGPELLSVKDAIVKLGADRIGHGIDSANHQEELDLAKDRGVVFEFCPTSNLVLGLLKDAADCKRVVDTWMANGNKFCVNTDDPVFFQINLKKEVDYLLDHGVLTPEQMAECHRIGREASFLNR